LFDDSAGTESKIASAGSSSRQISVKMSTLDAELQGQPAHFVKVDVEGFEKEVLMGASNLLNNPQFQVLIIERGGQGNRYGFDESDLHDSIRQRGFRPYAYDPFARKLLALSPAHLGNIIYLRDVQAAAGRVTSAPPVHIGEHFI
jgi:hypothetical protein